MVEKKTRRPFMDAVEETSEILSSENRGPDTDAIQEESDDQQLTGGLKLIPGETLIKTIEGRIEGEIRTVRVYYGNYVIPMINGKFKPLKQEAYQKVLNEFLDSKEGKKYDRPDEAEIKEALEEVKRVVEAYLKKQKILKAADSIQPGRTLPGPEKPKQKKPEEKEETVSPEEEQAFKDDVPSEEARAIEYIKNKNYTRQQIREIRKGLDSEKRRSTLGTLAIIAVALLVLGVAVFMIKDIAVRMHAQIELELKTGEITIRAGDAFNAPDYVKHVTEDESVYVIYPSLDTREIGEHRLDYIATNGVRNVRKTLTVTVIDGESPVIILTDEEIMLVRGRDEEGFDPLKYVKETHDNLDAELDVEVNGLDWSKDETSLTYRVRDSSGNSGKAILLVKIEDRVVCDKNAIYNSTTNTCRCRSGYNGDGLACSLIQTAPSAPAETTSSPGSSSGASDSGSDSDTSSGTSWSESWTIDYEDYQPSNGQSDVTYTNNDTGESYTVTDSDVGPYESDEDLWNEIDSLTGS